MIPMDRLVASAVRLELPFSRRIQDQATLRGA
jgi:hypothetical protein